MITFFADAVGFRAWLEQNHAGAGELVVGFHKKDAGLASIDWPQAVDEALCFGWIDGVRKRIDERSYQIRFTPRRAGSIWSAVNIARVEALAAEGRMQPAGLTAFARRSEAKSVVYAYEQAQDANLAKAEEAEFRRHPQAWAFLQAQAPSWRKKVLWWVVSAKQAATRERRLLQLIAACGEGRRL